MAGGLPILQSKLYRPRPAADVIVRPRLIDALDRGLQQPITLVSAPAGYGKSTLISQWIDGLDEKWKVGWYSVDASDNDLRTFLLYFVAAVQSAAPGTCETAADLLQQDSLPPVTDLVKVLGNDLFAAEQELIVVMDDLHLIRDPLINEFLVGFLAHPPPFVHLAIAARRDPALSLHRLRGLGQLNEVRVAELQFTPEEAGRFLGAGTDQDEGLSDSEAADLCAKVDGWPLALRLLALARLHQPESGAGGLSPGVPSSVGGYLVEEIIHKLPTDFQESLVRTAVVDRFCPGLCESLVPGLDGAAFVRHLVDSNLFAISLDGEERWYRYHHLFHESLRHLLHESTPAEEVSHLHILAATWFEDQGLIGDAFEHFLAAGDQEQAARVVVKASRLDEVNLDTIMDHGWLERLDAEVIENQPALLILQACVLQERNRSDDSIRLMDQVRSLLTVQKLDPHEERHMRGELALGGVQPAIQRRDFPTVVSLAEEALQCFDSKNLEGRATSYQKLVAGLGGLGDVLRARQVIEQGLVEMAKYPAGQVRLMGADESLMLRLAYVRQVRKIAGSLEAFCRQHRLRTAALGARAHAAFAAYQLNDLDDAERLCEAEPGERGIAPPWPCAVLHCIGAMTQHVHREHERAQQTLESLIELGNSRSMPLLAAIGKAHLALFAMQEGRLSEAVRWADHYRPPKYSANIYNLGGGALCARILIAEGSEASRSRAFDIIGEVLADAEQCHDLPPQIEILAIRALWHQGGSNQDAALADLGEAVRLAQPGGMVRVFASLGDSLQPLFQKLELDEEGLAYVGGILAAMANDHETTSAMPRSSEASPVVLPQPLVEPLSKRELEVLELLSQHFRNNEISARLYISVGTVKRHLSNVYGKLGVHGRREAVAKALGLGVLKS